MLRIIVREDNASMAAHVGGAVATTFRTFDVEIATIEAFLSDPKQSEYSHQQIIGIEVVKP